MVFRLLIIIVFLFLFFIPALAQEKDDNVEIGGLARCRFSGLADLKQTFGNKIKLKENSLSLALEDDFFEFTIEGEQSSNNEDTLIYLYTSTFELDFNKLLSGKKIDIESTDTELTLSKNENESEIEITNISSENSDEDVSFVSIQITKLGDDTADGFLRIRFPNTFLTDAENSTETGKLVVTCRFKDVPVNAGE